MTPQIARSMVISATTGIFIDGEEFGYYIANEGPDVSGAAQDELTIVSLPVIVDGFVLIETIDGRRRVIDGELGAGLGDIADWAKTFVRDQLGARLPWLILPGRTGLKWIPDEICSECRSYTWSQIHREHTDV